MLARRPWRAAWWELLGSMRFAISLLTLVAIASIIGTVVKQHEPGINYINQFGPFWAGLFRSLGLFDIYNTPWFLAIMGFLVASTTVCVTRNTPKILRDWRRFKESIRESSLRAFPYRWEGMLATDANAAQQALQTWLTRQGYRFKVDCRSDGLMLAARRGASNRLGYIATHLAIIVICVGGLLDSGLPLTLMAWLTGKTPIDNVQETRQIPDSARLPVGNPSYRANLLLPEGDSSHVAIVNTPQGLLVQELPFELRLRQFRVEYYSTGMPKLFASDVEVIDPAAGKRFAQTIEVNKPLTYRGVTVYQSSFDDGGSTLRLQAWPMRGNGFAPTALSGEVGRQAPLGLGIEGTTVEWSGFKSINVENVGESIERRFRDNVANVFGPGANRDPTRRFKNIGPSVTYRLRDAAGQAREYQNYMVPVDVDGGRYFLAGMRPDPNEPFRYLRLPVDGQESLAEFFRLRAALASPTLREQAARRYVDAAMQQKPLAATAQAQLVDSAQRILTMYAGDGRVGGLEAVVRFLEKTVPTGEREKASGVYLKILQGALWSLWNEARVAERLPQMAATPENVRYLQDAQLALSDIHLYGAPFLLQLTGFDEVKASVFQLARAPGQWIVYLGCLLLVAGVFAMFYIRERRVWFWLTPGAKGGPVRLLMGMSSNRATLDFENDYAALCATLRANAVPDEEIP
jgi:cytochrome c biogenesis protein